MKAFVALLLVAVFTAADALPLEAQDAASTLVFEHVNVIPMDTERVLEDQTIVVLGDRITAIGPAGSVSVPPDAQRIDGHGRYLMPGLAEMHGHIPPPTAPAALTEQVLFLYLAGGITTVRGMLGAPGQLDLRERVNRGELLAPTLYLAGPSFNGQSVNAPEQAVEMVRRQADEGWDLLKVHPGLTRAEYDAMAETAHEEGIRFGGHVPEEVGLLHAIEMGQETFDHLDGYVEHLNGDQGPVQEEALAEVVRRTREAGAWVVPTMALWEVLYGTADLDTLRSYQELAYVPPDQRAGWESWYTQRLADPNLDPQASRHVIANRIRILQALHEGGARILMGTDAPQLFSVPGFSIHRELRRMEAAGMSPYEILRTGTVNVGTYFADEDTFGTITEGQRADMVLLGANPLEDLAHLQQIEGIMVRGRWVPGAEMKERLQAIKKAHAAP